MMDVELDMVDVELDTGDLDLDIRELLCTEGKPGSKLTVSISMYI